MIKINIDKAKEKYNKLLERERAATNYLNNATDKEFKKWLPEFQKITRQLSVLGAYLKSKGIEI